MLNFLEYMSKRYELIVYTAAENDYADAVLNLIEYKMHRQIFAYRLYGQQCVKLYEMCVFKYLDILCGDRDIKDIVLVDNTVRNYALSIRNGLPIKAFKGDENDKEFIYLAKYLRMLTQEENMQIKIKEDFAAYLLDHENIN